MIEEIYVKFVSMLTDNLVLTICFIIGISDFLIMCHKSAGSYKYSNYRQDRIDNMNDWLQNYNDGIYPVLGTDEVWSYSDEGCKFS